MTSQTPQVVTWIPVDQINVPNPRLRDDRVFQEITRNIAVVGLKRPITVTRSAGDDEAETYDLVCGQGRLEAFRALGQDNVPALVVTADKEDALIASLVENCARRSHTAIELLRDIGGMRDRGHSTADIARHTGLSEDYVLDVSRLLAKGEERLLRAVEAGQMPITVAVQIADTDDPGVQNILQDAYDDGSLRGRKLLAAKRLVESRSRQGKRVHSARRRKSGRLSTAELISALQDESERKNDLIRRANLLKDRLLLIVESLRRLRADDRFMAIVEDEGITTIPKVLADRLDRLGEFQ